MGVDFEAEDGGGCGMSYSSFHILRECIAHKAVELGYLSKEAIYPAGDDGKDSMWVYIDAWKEDIKVKRGYSGLKYFLNHSDCDGHWTGKQVEKIYKVLIDIRDNAVWHDDESFIKFDLLEELLEVLSTGSRVELC